MLYNDLGNATFNDLGAIQYNSFVKPASTTFFTRLPGARPVILSQDHQVVAVIENVSEMTLNQEINGADTMDFTVPYDDPKTSYLVNENIVQIVEKQYVIRMVSKSRADDGTKLLAVYAEALWYDLQYTDPLSSAQWMDVTPDIPIQDILAGTGWNVGTIEVDTDRNLVIESGVTNRLKLLREVADIWGGTLIFDSKELKVSLIENSFPDPGIGIIYRKNLKSIKASYDTQDLITRLYPYGKNDMTIEDANDGVPYIENYQYTKQVRVRSFKDGRFTNPFHLKEKAESILSKLSVPRASYRATAADLSNMTGLEHEAFDLGAMVMVHDEEMEINLKTQIVKWSYDVLEPWNTELELSTVQPGLEDLLKSVTETTEIFQSEDTLNQQDMLDLMVSNYLLNSRADDGYAYWTNNGWDIDSSEGYSGPASFKAVGQYDTTKTLTQTVYPSHRDSYSLSFRAATENLNKGPNGKVGVNVTITYKDGSKETKYIPLA
ncbi:phage tail protein [Alkalihalobacillus sp. AL-G]|uniref:phage tail protein n=1 Tax=Alkalihalobacillus sp. AL-G TaxID=2926399 RepID=UPI00272B7163|nr:phage tail protein [Alkalihalobacillus sp. AL-G]WLD92638.1 phage tail protein [Alkalihalobacillus sp. AL-G]